MKQRLMRSDSDKMIAGVCGGLAEYMDIDLTIVRLVFAGAFLFGFGSSGLLYLLMWVIVPRGDNLNAEPKAVMQAGVQEMAEKGRQVVEEVKKKVSGQEEGTDVDSTD